MDAARGEKGKGQQARARLGAVATHGSIRDAVPGDTAASIPDAPERSWTVLKVVTTWPLL